MSSFNIRNIREISNDPLTKFSNSVARKLARFLTKDQVDQLADNEDIYSDGQDLESVIRVHDELQSQNKFQFATQYLPPSEPDGVKQTLWIRGTNLGNNIKDWSSFNNECILFRAEPLLMDGTPFDTGIHTNGVKSLCLRFNRPSRETTNIEHIRVTNNTRLQVSGITTGISYFMRFRLLDLAQQNGFNRTLFQKIDDITPNNGVMVQVTTDGKLIFILKRSGVTTANETAAGTILANTVYEVWFTYNVTGPVMKIYVNNVDKALSAYGGSVVWSPTLTQHDLMLFRHAYDLADGFVYGDLYDFEIFREKVVSTTEVGRHYTNKWTLADIPFGRVIIANYWATYLAAAVPSYTGASFTSGSFDI